MAAAGIQECEINIPEKIKKLKKEYRLLLMAFEMKRIAENSEYGGSTSSSSNTGANASSATG